MLRIQNQGNDETVWRISVSGENFTQITHGVFDRFISCSPDGKWLYFFSSEGKNELRRISVDGGKSDAVFAGKVRASTVSPDSTLVAIFSSQGTDVGSYSRRLEVMPSQGGPLLLSVPTDSFTDTRKLAFSPDGKSIVFIRTIKGVSNLWMQPLAGGAAKQITDFRDGLIFDFAYSRDGKQLALARGQRSSDAVLIRDSSR